MILLEEVELLLQAVQVPSQRGDDLVVVGLRSPQSLAVPLHRLAEVGLRLPPSERTQRRIQIRGNVMEISCKIMMLKPLDAAHIHIHHCELYGDGHH